MSRRPVKRRRLLAPEVVQTSAMDCGPACLKSLLAGFGIRAAYGRLREACQTDLDGTSIDTIEEAARELGLEAEQVMLPADHVLLPEAGALPAMAVVRQPNGLTHFVVVWRRHGGWVQLMDPATGRRWQRVERFLAELYRHRLEVPAADWRAWAGDEENRRSMTARLAALGVTRRHARRLVEEACEDPSWRALATLDAAVRMAAAVVDSGGLRRGRQAAALVDSLLAEADPEAIPAAYWQVRPAPAAQRQAGSGERPEAGRADTLVLHGVVLVRIRGRRAAADATAPELSPELAAALTEPPARPARTLWGLVRRSGWTAPLVAAGLALVAAGGVVFEAVLLRGFFDLGADLAVPEQRLGAMAVLLGFLALLLLVELPAAEGALRLGRHLEARLRLAFLAKIPRLGDRYFRSRLTSDMAERSHNAHRLRQLPELGEGLGRMLFELALTAAGILWLDPGAAPLVAATVAAALLVPLSVLPTLEERDLKVRNHSGALSRFYLDALLGLVPLRAHGAESAIRREHESLLVEWVEARFGRERAVVAIDVALHLALLGLVAWLLVDHLARRELSSGVLLLVFWALNLFTLGRFVTLLLAYHYPTLRNLALRLLEPLGAPEEPVEAAAAARTAAPAIELRAVSVRVAGHTILEDVALSLAPGEHVAVVGRSGAGKSTLAGLLLGWYRPGAGSLLVDGAPLGPAALAALRERTAWVDPQVQLWNRPVLANLLYGNETGAAARAGWAVREADLLELLEALPDGLQTPLGESGALVSGGEGQRVRLGRAFLRREVGLAIFDEPFRGLARSRRRELLARARRLWHDATFLTITHDVGETLGFPRVVVMDAGRLVEDGRPEELAGRPGSLYARLLAAERQLLTTQWKDPAWRRLRVAGGRLRVTEPGGQR